MRKPAGFTLIEGLIGLSLSIFIITAGLEFFVRTEKAFSRLKTREEAGQAALAALDRIRIDLLHAGRGLSAEIALGLIEAAEVVGGELRTASAERELRLAAGAAAGATRLLLASTADIAPGRRIALRQGAAGEVRTVIRVEPGAAVLDGPVERSYDPETATVSLLELVTCFLDARSGVLRRRVNGTSAQPLVDDAAAVTWDLDRAASLVRIRLELDDPVSADIEGAHPHEATVFLKNPALARNSGT
jgi:type II secretory pathway pseudopilin PulG